MAPGEETKDLGVDGSQFLLSSLAVCILKILKRRVRQEKKMAQKIEQVKAPEKI